MDGSAGNRQEVGEGYSETDAPPLVLGWCTACTCGLKYHVGSDDGSCIECSCLALVKDPESERWERLQSYLLEELPADYIQVEVPVVLNTPELLMVPITLVVEDLVVYPTAPVPAPDIFLGKISRGCRRCGDIKLYAEFLGSSDPELFCKQCCRDLYDDDLIQKLSAEEREELEALEDQILENELAYEEAQQRQEIIDNVLRELDE